MLRYASPISKDSVPLIVYFLKLTNRLSDVPGRAWAQALGSGWASEGLGLRNLKPNPELRAGPGLGLVGLKPGLSSQNSNATIVG